MQVACVALLRGTLESLITWGNQPARQARCDARSLEEACTR